MTYIQPRTTFNEKIAYSFNELSIKTTLSKAYLRKEIQEGRLKIKRAGRRGLILTMDWRDFVDGK